MLQRKHYNIFTHKIVWVVCEFRRENEMFVENVVDRTGSQQDTVDVNADLVITMRKMRGHGPVTYIVTLNNGDKLNVDEKDRQRILAARREADAHIQTN